MDIEIITPIYIGLDVLEFDEHLPSMKFSVTIQINKYGYMLNINTEIWVECHEFDKFVDGMKKKQLSILKDMNDIFELQLDIISSRFKWVCGKQDLNGDIVTSKGEENLTEELSESLYEAFNNYPKWW